MGSESLNLLLDTHIILWSLLEPSRLGSGSKKLFSEKNLKIWISAISIWEILVLAQKGRIQLDPDAVAWTRKHLIGGPFLSAPLTDEIAILSRQLTLSHEDPADRFLAATAAVYDLTLLTADTRLLEGTGYSVAANS